MPGVPQKKEEMTNVDETTPLANKASDGAAKVTGGAVAAGEKAAHAVGDATSRAAEAVGDRTKKTASAVGDAATRAKDATARAGQKAASTVVGASERALSAVGGGAERVGDILMGKWERAMSSIRPWPEFMSVSDFGGLVSVRDLPSRIAKNLNYFRFNYLVLWIVFVAISMLIKPLRLLGVLVLIFEWVLLFGVFPGDSMRIGDVVFSENAKVGILVITGFLVFGLAHAEKLFLTAAIFTAAVAVAHAAFRQEPPESVDDAPIV